MIMMERGLGGEDCVRGRGRQKQRRRRRRDDKGCEIRIYQPRDTFSLSPLLFLLLTPLPPPPSSISSPYQFKNPSLRRKTHTNQSYPAFLHSTSLNASSSLIPSLLQPQIRFYICILIIATYVSKTEEFERTRRTQTRASKCNFPSL